jgi:hypothetical protein
MSNEKIENNNLEELIEDFLKKRPGTHYSSEIADALGSGYIVTFNVVKKLLKDVKKAKALPAETKTVRERK